MKKEEVIDDDPLDHEIDLTKSRPNPYWLGVVNRHCVRLLDEDLADIFPDNAAVNAALLTIAEAGRRALPQKVSASTATTPKPKKKKARL
jgi:hypothetical protein